MGLRNLSGRSVLTLSPKCHKPRDSHFAPRTPNDVLRATHTGKPDQVTPNPPRQGQKAGVFAQAGNVVTLLERSQHYEADFFKDEQEF